MPGLLRLSRLNLLYSRLVLISIILQQVNAHLKYSAIFLFLYDIVLVNTAVYTKPNAKILAITSFQGGWELCDFEVVVFFCLVIIVISIVFIIIPIIFSTSK